MKRGVSRKVKVAGPSHVDSFTRTKSSTATTLRHTDIRRERNAALARYASQTAGKFSYTSYLCNEKRITYILQHFQLKAVQHSETYVVNKIMPSLKLETSPITLHKLMTIWTGRPSLLKPEEMRPL